jgi:hypothetical protein
MRKVVPGFNVRLVIAPGTARRWIDQFGPHLSTLVGVELTVERAIDGLARRGLLDPEPADAHLLAAAFEVLTEAADLVATLPPVPDADAQAELTAALAEVRRAAGDFAASPRRLDAVREALARADFHLLRLGERAAPPPPSAVGGAGT